MSATGRTRRESYKHAVHKYLASFLTCLKRYMSEGVCASQEERSENLCNNKIPYYAPWIIIPEVNHPQEKTSGQYFLDKKKPRSVIPPEERPLLNPEAVWSKHGHEFQAKVKIYNK